MSESRATVVAVTGAESTGKTTLVHELAGLLRAQGLRVAVVSEALRDFCEQHGRTPQAHEQAGLAYEQSRRIAEAALGHDLVLADTTALTIAVYSDYIFGDLSLYPQAERDHAMTDLTLLTALDLPWVADGVQRDGAHVREPVDALIRQALLRSGQGFAVVQGQGAERTQHALSAVHHLIEAPRRRQAEPAPRWRWVCADCDDGECERHLRLLPRR